MPSLKFVFAAAALLVAANAKIVKITATADNRFDPDSATVKKGDFLEFNFKGPEHSVVSGDYQNPCAPLQIGTGFFSGFISGSSDKVFRVEVDNTDAMIFYSSQGNACASGMVGIVNPAKNKSLQNYKSRASKLSEGVSPGYAPFGGELADKGSSDGDSKSGDKFAQIDKKSDTKDALPIRLRGNKFVQ